jgi:hypothetical protein
LFDYTYGYDLVGNVLVIGETYPAGLNNRTVTNTYDSINRLLAEAVTGNAPNATSTYTYDNANNLTFQDQYNSAGNQIATTGSTLDRQKSNSKDCDPWGGINDGQRYTIIVGCDLRLFMTRDPAGFVDGLRSCGRRK